MSVFFVSPISELLKILHPFRRDLTLNQSHICLMPNLTLIIFPHLCPTYFLLLCVPVRHNGESSYYCEEVKNLSELTCTHYWLHCSAGCIMGWWHWYCHDMVVGLPWLLLSVFDFPHTFCGLKEIWYRFKLEAMWLKPTHKVKGAPHQIPPEISYADHPQLQEEEVWQLVFGQV